MSFKLCQLVACEYFKVKKLYGEISFTKVFNYIDYNFKFIFLLKGG